MPTANVAVRIKLSNLPWALHLVEMMGDEQPPFLHKIQFYSLPKVLYFQGIQQFISERCFLHPASR